MERLKEWAWWCWDLLVEWYYTVDRWLNVVLYPIEKAIVWLAVRAWDLRGILFATGGVAFAVAGLYNTHLLSNEPGYDPGPLGFLAFIQCICLGLGGFGLYLNLIGEQDGELGSRASSFAAYTSYYLKTLFAGIVMMWAKVQLLLQHVSIPLY